MASSVSLCRRSAIVMDTAVTLSAPMVEDALFQGMTDRAFAWFHTVERTCSRFDPGSEVMRLTAQAGRPVVVSALLYEAVRFALTIAEITEGAFDPTVGLALERRGFNRHYVTGATVATPIPDGAPPSFRDVLLDEQRRTLTLRRPLVLDLGAVVKGLAIDLAARELAPLGSYSIDAGGDLFVAGRNAAGEAWRVGIRHPRDTGALATVLAVSNMAVCTSGDYERPSPSGEHHVLDPRTGHSPMDLASVTVVAPNAMLADALSTAAFVLGPERGRALLTDQGVEGLFITATLEQRMTAGMAAYVQ